MSDRSHATLRFLRELATAPHVESASDAELVGNFAATGDEPAFAALLRRHGPMVLGVCRRALRDDHAAEDAFQATFLVLAARAGSLRRRGSVGAWLHGVAVRVARRAAEGRRREARARAPVGPDELPDRPVGENADLREALDVELSRLPERYRAALLLCDLEGLSAEEAAARLGWSEGAVRAGLWRGRKRLRAALARRGLPAAPLAVLPALPGPLYERTLTAARLFIAGDRPAGGGAALAEGVLRTMRASSWGRRTAALLLIIALAGSAALAGGLVAPLRPLVRAPAPKAADDRRLIEAPAEVLAVAVSPDGKQVATGCADRTVRVWEVETGTQRAVLEGHLGPVRALAFTPDRKELVAVSNVKGRIEARRWDVSAARSTASVTFEGPTPAVSLSPGGKLLAAGNDARTVTKGVGLGEVVLYDPATGNQVGKLTGLGHHVNALAFSPDGNRLGAVGEEPPVPGRRSPGRVAAWRLDGRALLFSAVGAAGYNRALAFSADGGVLAVGDDAGASLWDVAKGRASARLPGEGYEVRATLFSPDGKTVFTGNKLGAVRQWVVGTGKAAGPLARAGDAVNCLAATPDGRRLVAGGTSQGRGAFRVWAPSAAKGNDYFFPHSKEVFGLAVSPDGRTMLAAVDKYFQRWGLDPVAELLPLTGHGHWTWAAAYSPDGKTVATAGEEWNTLRVFEAGTGKAGRVLRHGGAGTIRALAFSPDGRTVASAGNLGNASGFRGGQVVLWDVTTGKARAPFPATSQAYADVAFSPDGKSLAGACWDGALRVWNVADARERLKFSPHGGIFAVRFFSDGKALVTGGRGRGGEVKLWDAGSGKLLGELKAGPGTVMAVAVSPDGGRVAAADWEGRVMLWDRASRRRRWAVQGHTGNVYAVTFLPNGTTVASSGRDGLVRLWDAETGRERLWP
jgi:RNA polymerase sigma factor (sigma-70 family)